MDTKRSIHRRQLLFDQQIYHCQQKESLGCQKVWQLQKWYESFFEIFVFGEDPVWAGNRSETKKKIEKIELELKNGELSETIKNMKKMEISDLRQKINEMEQKKMIRKLDRIKEI